MDCGEIRENEHGEERGIKAVMAMSDAIVVALITGACAIISQLLIARANSKELYAKMDKQQAVMEERITTLTAEVKEHNNFAKRMPVLEEKVSALEKKVG